LIPGDFGPNATVRRRSDRKKERTVYDNQQFCYKFIRNNGGWYNWTMVMVEKYPCKSKLESDMRERYWIETLKANLNSIVTNRNNKERYEENKIEIAKGELSEDQKIEYRGNINSYLGLMKHYNTYKLRKKIFSKSINNSFLKYFIIPESLNKIILR
jgi:hypothetical protein